MVENGNGLAYKKNIKTSVWNAFSKEVLDKKKTHTNVKHIKYDQKTKPQKCLLNCKFNNEMVSLLYNLRCHSVNEFREYFHTMYGQALICHSCETHIDSQELSLSCIKVI